MPLTKNKPRTEIKSMIGLQGVADNFGVTRRCIQGWIQDGTFPQPIRIGRRLLRWEIDGLNDWISAGCPRIEQEQDR